MPDRFTTVNLLDLLNEIISSYLVIDEESCIVTISDNLASKLGYDPEELIGYSYTCVTPDKTRDWINSASQKLKTEVTRQKAWVAFVQANKAELSLPVSMLAISGESSPLYLIIDETETPPKA